MKAVLEILELEVQDIVTTSDDNGVGGSKDCEVFEGIPLE